MEKGNQTLFIDNELNKTFQSSHCSGIFIESFKGQNLSKNKVQWLDLAFRLWQTLIGLPLASIINIHYEIIIKYFRPHLISSSLNYCLFMQYTLQGIISISPKVKAQVTVTAFWALFGIIL
jgi:hypothetical protein